MTASTPGMQAERWSAIMFRVRGVVRRFWWIPLITLSIGLAISAVMVSRQETWFRSGAKLMVSGRIQFAEGNAYTEEFSNFFGTQVELMKSSKVQEQARARIQAAGKVAPATVSSFEIGVLPNSSIFVLQATAQTGEYSQAFLEAIIAEYIALKRGMRTEKSESTISALTDELLRLEKEWQTGEDELAAFQKQHSLVFLREGENAAARYLAGLNERLADLSTQLRLFQHLELEQLRGLELSQKPSANGVVEEVPEFIKQTEYLKAQQQIEVLEQKRALEAETKKEDHPVMDELNKDIAAQKRLLVTYREQAKAELELRQRSLESQIKAINEEMEQWKGKALEIGKLMSEYARLQAKVERPKGLYEKLLATMGNVDLTKNLSQDVISVLERPSGASPVRPGMDKTLTSGALAGLLVGCFILFLLDRSSAHLASPEEFISSFEERVIGIVPQDKNAEQVLQVTDQRHAFAEAFYNIRSSLFFLQYDGPMPKILLVTSSIPNEGKSTLSTNIAMAFAFAGSRTLLIDGDLRRGEIHKKFGVSNSKGFSDVLQRRALWRDTVIPTETPNLSVIPRGSSIAQPSKYLVHSSTDDLLRELYAEYDQVIIDSCPVLAADDTTSLAPKVEAVLVVARIGVASRRHVNSTLASLKSRQANVLGCILNGVDLTMTSYTYSSYSEYYSKEPTLPVEMAK